MPGIDGAQCSSRHTGYVPIRTSTSDFSVLWSTQLPMAGSGFNPRVTGAGRVFLGSTRNLIVTQNQRMVSFDLAAGTVAWEASVPTGYYELNQPSLADGTIYDGKGSTVYMLSEADGSTISTWALPNGGTIESTVVLTKTHFIVSTSQGTYAVSRRNPSRPAWQIAAHGQLALSREGVLVIAGADGTVTGVRLR